MSVKVFVVHHKIGNVFRNSIFEPIQTGSDFSKTDLGFLKDNSGDNIAFKNPFYGELTAWYWVLRNWLPSHPEVSHIGFCHYRRVLDVTRCASKWRRPFTPISWACFQEVFKSEAYREETFEDVVTKYDILLPGKESLMSFRNNFIGTLYDQFCAGHPQRMLDRSIDVAIRSQLAFPEQVKEVLCGTSFHPCLNFIMKRDLFESLANWMFRLLDEATADFDMNIDLPYNEIRAPAFIAERFFDIWLSRQVGELRIKECNGYLIGNDPYPDNIAWYLSGIKQIILWGIGIKQHKKLPNSVA